jgi:hypothetical protein
MKRTILGLFVLGVATSVAVSSIGAPRRTTRTTAKNGGQQQQPVIDPTTGQPVIDPTTGQPIVNRNPQGGGKEENKGPDLPGDPQLLKLHQEFVAKTAKLAKDYERQQDIEKARECYERILKLIPRLPEAEQALAKIKEKQLNAEKKRMVVNANGAWQDTGVDLIAGKPVLIEASGIWTFRMSNELGPDGMEIPEELRDFNLGSLIGMIGNANAGDGKNGPKPFLIGSSVEFTPEQAGRLFLRMYDSDPSDNQGKLNVEIRGTFEKSGK